MAEEKKKKIVVAVSGGFDPIHAGHVEMFWEAKALGDELVVILNNDNWLRKKKNYKPKNWHCEIPHKDRWSGALNLPKSSMIRVGLT